MVMRRQGIHATRTILGENTGRSSSAHPFSRRFSPIAADSVLLDAIDEDMPGNVEIGGRLGDVPPFQAEGTLDHFLFEIDQGESSGGKRRPVVRESLPSRLARPGRGGDGGESLPRNLVPPAPEHSSPPFSWRTRSSFAWRGRGISPISSRNRVPPAAWRNRPRRSRTAPVNAPRACPNSSDSRSSAGSAARLPATKTFSARGDR